MLLIKVHVTYSYLRLFQFWGSWNWTECPRCCFLREADTSSRMRSAILLGLENKENPRQKWWSLLQQFCHQDNTRRPGSNSCSGKIKVLHKLCVADSCCSYFYLSFYQEEAAQKCICPHTHEWLIVDASSHKPIFCAVCLALPVAIKVCSSRQSCFPTGLKHWSRSFPLSAPAALVGTVHE